MRIHRHRQRKSALNIQKYKANDRIRSEEVRVIDENGQALGVMPTAKAIALAQEKELDLVKKELKI